MFKDTTMGEKVSGLFLNSGFLGRLSTESQPKMLNKGDHNSFSDLFEVSLRTIFHSNLKL